MGDSKVKWKKVLESDETRIELLSISLDSVLYKGPRNLYCIYFLAFNALC